MTLIDNISFRFRMTDELFARELYADWDGFCQRCVTDVLEEFFYRYDKKDIYMEIGRLDLDLGGIPQEEFYGSFPVRLREALWTPPHAPNSGRRWPFRIPTGSEPEAANAFWMRSARHSRPCGAPTTGAKRACGKI